MVRVIGSQLYNNRGPGGCLISFVLVQGEKKEIIHALLEIKTQILNYVCFMITRPSAKLEQFGFAFPFFC